MRIEEICRMAKAEGLSYGQYVFKHRAELAGIKPTAVLRSDGHYCRRCGREFTPKSNRHHFCRTACRVAYNQKKRREAAHEQ